MERETQDLRNLYCSGQISRRSFLSRAALLGLSAGAVQSILTSCTPQSAPAPQTTTKPATGAAGTAAAGSPAASAIKRGGTLTHAINWTVPTMDPHVTTLPQHLIYENVYDGLLRLETVDPKTWELKPVGVLAESWQQTDGKTVVFKLKQGIKFHDGSEFDAEVAKWNVERARDHPKSQLKASLGAIESVRAVDNNTLEIKSKTDNAALVRVLSFTNGGLVRMVSKAAFDKNGEEWLQRNPVGTGSFKFKQWVTDDRVILDRNPEYFMKAPDGQSYPYLDSLVMRYIPDPTVGLTDMRAGTVQVLEWMAFKDIDVLKNDPSLAYVELPWAGQVYFMVGYNSESGPFKDPLVRQAANYGIDRVAMHKALGFGVGEPHHYPYWLKGAPGYDENILKYEYNPAKVKELLTQAGYPNGVDVELKVIAREPENTIGEFVQQMWTAVGIRTKLVAQERLSWIDAVRAKNFQSCFWRGALWAIVDPELSRTLIGCGAPTNWQQFCDPEVDKLMDEGLKELDAAKRPEIYKKVYTLLQERAYAGSGFLAPVVDAYRKEVKGIDFNFQTFNMKATHLG